MQRILYISTARETLADATLTEILRVSRRNNAAVGVTGLLVVGGRRFLQVLEGPEAAVTTVFERIARDPRHFAVVKLSRKEIETRTFGEWSMGYRTVDMPRGADGEPGSLPQVVERLVAPIEDAMLRAEFTSFAALHGSR
jgi:hypothetical protein